MQSAFEKGKWQYGWTGQSISQLMQTDSLAKKCFGVLLEMNIIKVDYTTFMNMVKENTLLTVLKKLEVYGVGRVTFEMDTLETKGCLQESKFAYFLLEICFYKFIVIYSHFTNLINNDEKQCNTKKF